MSAKTFKTIFTADISQFRSQMGGMKRSAGSVVGEIRNELAMLAGVSFAGYQLGGTIEDIISLGAAMQQTRTAFEVMLGSAEKGNEVLGKLNQFADVTPFDNKNVIAAGRQLMNAGIETDKLTSKLTVLGNIAAGAQIPLEGMAAIYAKAANKGKVQAEELNQLSERGVPVLQSLAATLGKTTGEVLDLGAKGQLSFGLLDDALSSLSNNGGKYFGLMEKQSRNLGGQWSNLMALIRNTAIEVGEDAIPQLSNALSGISAELQRMKKNGQLDEFSMAAAQSLGKVAVALKDLLVYVVKNQETIKRLAKGAFYLGAAFKIRGILVSAAMGLATFAAAARTSTVASTSAATAITATSTAAKAASAEVGMLGKATGSLASGMSSASLVIGTAIAGWGIGKALANFLDLEKVFTRLLLKAQGMSKVDIEKGLNPQHKKLKPSVKKEDLTGINKQKTSLKKEIAKLKTDATAATGTENESPIRAHIKTLEKDLASLEATENKYLTAAKKAVDNEKEISAKFSAARKDERKLRSELVVLNGEHKQAILNPEQGFYAGRKNTAKDLETAIAKKQKELESAVKKRDDLQKKQNETNLTIKDYNKNKAELKDYNETKDSDNAVNKTKTQQFKEDEAANLKKKTNSELDQLRRNDTENAIAAIKKKMEERRQAYKAAGITDKESLDQLNALEQAALADIEQKRKKSAESILNAVSKMTLSETDFKIRELNKQLQAYKAAGASELQVARLKAVGLAKIDQDRRSKIKQGAAELNAALKAKADAGLQNKINLIMKNLDKKLLGLNKKLGGFGFNKIGDLPKDAHERRIARKNTKLDKSIAEKTEEAKRGKNVHFTRAERRRIDQREKIEQKIVKVQKNKIEIREKQDQQNQEAQIKQLDKDVVEALATVTQAIKDAKAKPVRGNLPAPARDNHAPKGVPSKEPQNAQPQITKAPSNKDVVEALATVTQAVKDAKAKPIRGNVPAPAHNDRTPKGAPSKEPQNAQPQIVKAPSNKDVVEALATVTQAVKDAKAKPVRGNVPAPAHNDRTPKGAPSKEPQNAQPQITKAPSNKDVVEALATVTQAIKDAKAKPVRGNLPAPARDNHAPKGAPRDVIQNSRPWVTKISPEKNKIGSISQNDTITDSKNNKNSIFNKIYDKLNFMSENFYLVRGG